MSEIPSAKELFDDAPILSKYHGQRGFEDERFIADYYAWQDKWRPFVTAASPDPHSVEDWEESFIVKHGGLRAATVPVAVTGPVSDEAVRVDLRMLETVAKYMEEHDESPRCAADLRQCANRITSILAERNQLQAERKARMAAILISKGGARFANWIEDRTRELMQESNAGNQTESNHG